MKEVIASNCDDMLIIDCSQLLNEALSEQNEIIFAF